MEVISTISEFRAARTKLTKPLGFIPTMGYLHAGHLALIKRAREENGVVAVSIFVNAMQFNEAEDLERYPRDMERDLEMLREAKVDIVFTPEHNEIYPDDFFTTVHVMGLTERLEGAARMGHFDGVSTVVCKLFNIVQPDRAYFGQKDAQQLVVVRHMVKDLNLPIEIVGVPTVRERDGLA
nr:pantoate--beta-alanine ligase [Ardenticatenales bacterium]